MKFKPYPHYKASGVEWLGDVPVHWEVKRLKFVFPRLFSGVSVNSDNSPTMDESPAILKTSCVYGNRFRPEENKRVLETELDRVACPVTRNSLIISRMNTPELVGSCGYVEADFSHLFLPDRLWIARFQNHSAADGKFTWYLTISHAMCALTASLATGTSDSMKNLTQEAFLDIPVGVPPLTEQLAIAAFLDRKTRRVDRLVAKKRELIERLKEKRTALISRTVTRGLPPAVARAAGLPENPPLKPSGLDWLGDVPEHWQVKAIKWESPVKRGASPRPIDDERFFDDEGEYAWVRIADVTAAGPFLEKTEQRMSPLGSSLSVKLKPCALFLSIAGTVGKPCITTIKCCIHDGFVYFPRWKGDTKFLFYIFASGEPYKGLGKMGTQLNLNTDTVGSIKIGQPPLPEQAAIARYLDKETEKLDALVGRVEEAVERLQEYRTALITAAVTGKIDVGANKIAPPDLPG